MPSRLLAICQWSQGKSCTWVHDVWFIMCMSYHEAISRLVITNHCLSFWLHTYIYIYIYISIWKPFNDVFYKAKIVLKTHIFCKIFCFLYRSFVSFCMNKQWSRSSCTKLALSESWPPGLIAQSVRASEWNSVVAGSNPTQALRATFYNYFKESFSGEYHTIH